MNLPEPPRRSFVRQVFSFGLVSAVGLAIDLGGFALLTGLGVVPWLANGVSSVLSITAVYFLATRYTFGANTRLSTYLLFFGWYLMMIVLTSSAIQIAATLSEVHPFILKLATIPLSFTANFFFSKYLFRPRSSGAPA